MSTFKDDKFEILKDDIERIRVRTTVYISYVGKRGAAHLTHELTQNSIDEHSSPHSPQKMKLDLFLNENDNVFICADDGRGFPPNMVEPSCTIMHSGSKLHKSKDKNGRTAGENGIGLTAINALSEFMVFDIYRDGVNTLIKFVDGKVVDTKTKPCDKSKHGTTVTFKPSEKYLGKCQLSGDDFAAWVEGISYSISPDISLSLTVIPKGKDTPVKMKYKNKNGLADLFTKKFPKTDAPIVRIKGSTSTDDIDVECAFGYISGNHQDFANVISYCNFVNTVDHGQHVNGAKTGWCMAMMKLAKEYMSDKEFAKYTPNFDDCRMGMGMTIAVFCDDPRFSGQTKEKVENDALYDPIKRFVNSAVSKYYKANISEAKKVVNTIKTNARARLEINKVKKSDYKAPDVFEEASMKNFTPAKSPEYQEMYLVEGDSAGDGVTAACDHMFQAVFKFKGNPKNVYGCSIVDIMNNNEFKCFIKALGCGIGKDFDISKCRYKKIIIMVDSDIDGYNMTSLICAAIMYLMPGLITAGRLYKALAPLYVMKDKKHPYLLSKNEYYDLFASNVIKHTELVSCTDNHKFTNKELKELISNNRDYLTEIDGLQKYFFAPHEIIEWVILNRHAKDLGAVIKQKFPELEYYPKTGYLVGSYKLSDHTIILDDEFYDKCKRLERMINESNNGQIYYHATYDGKVVPGEVSLGSVLMMNKAYLPETDKRIKGLGELDVETLWKTTLDPTKRELIRLTIGDLEREMETVNILHGSDSELRKEFMKGYILNKEDLDT